MKKTFILLIILLFSTFDTKAQDLPTTMTIAGLQELVNGTIDKLTNAGTTLLGNGSIVINGATQQLSTTLTQFNNMIHVNVTTPINQLSGDIKNLANQLYSTTSRLNSILNQQQQCLLLNTQIALAGIQTITSEFKNGIPLVSSDAPRLNYFQFEGHSPSIIPKSGGRIKIVGYLLWKNNKIPPIVAILNEERNVIVQNIIPERGPDDNSFLFNIDTAIIRKNAGQCLQIRVQVKKKTLFSSKDMGTFYLPVCIPAYITKELQVVAHLQYPCEKNTEQNLGYKGYNLDNTSCEDRKNVTQTQCWTLPDNAQIIGFVYQNGHPNLRNQSNIGVTINGNCITAAGWLDNASCTPVVHHLFHSSYWMANIAPTISFKEITNKVSNAQSAFIKMDKLSTNLCVDIDKDCNGSIDNVFWFEIIQRDGDKITTIYQSQRTTGTTMPGDNSQGFTIDANLNPSPVNGKAQICVKITQPDCGGL
jgi:hypothetical protein